MWMIDDNRTQQKTQRKNRFKNPCRPVRPAVARGLRKKEAKTGRSSVHRVSAGRANDVGSLFYRYARLTPSMPNSASPAYLRCSRSNAHPHGRAGDHLSHKRIRHHRSREHTEVAGVQNRGCGVAARAEAKWRHPCEVSGDSGTLDIPN